MDLFGVLGAWVVVRLLLALCGFFVVVVVVVVVLEVVVVVILVFISSSVSLSAFSKNLLFGGVDIYENTARLRKLVRSTRPSPQKYSEPESSSLPSRLK